MFRHVTRICQHWPSSLASHHLCRLLAGAGASGFVIVQKSIIIQSDKDDICDDEYISVHINFSGMAVYQKFSSICTNNFIGNIIN